MIGYAMHSVIFDVNKAKRRISLATIMMLNFVKKLHPKCLPFTTTMLHVAHALYNQKGDGCTTPHKSHVTCMACSIDHHKFHHIGMPGKNIFHVFLSMRPPIHEKLAVKH